MASETLDDIHRMDIPDLVRYCTQRRRCRSIDECYELEEGAELLRIKLGRVNEKENVRVEYYDATLLWIEKAKKHRAILRIRSQGSIVGIVPKDDRQ